MSPAAKRDRESGQASLELLGVLPLLVAVAGLGWQAALTGQAWWLTRVAADSAARAQALGDPPLDAARRALPSRLRAGLVLKELDGGAAVEVRVRLPEVLGLDLGSATAISAMERQR